jgi:hypothetical protein
MSSLASEIRRLAQRVQSDETSTTNWRPIELAVAEALGMRAYDVYASTVSKSGNLSVRMDQSPRARAAPVFVAMFTGPRSDEDRCVEAARRHGAGRSLVLVFADDAQGKTLLAIVKPRGQAVPATLASAYPGAGVADFS